MNDLAGAAPTLGAGVPVVPGPVAASVRWALLFGNFVIGCGVMAVAGALNDISRSLQVSVSLAGQLVAAGGVVVCFGAPLLAGWIAGFDRRRLLMLSLLWFAAGHALCALAPSYAALLPLRTVTLLAAAVFSPQAAAAIGVMTTAADRGRALTFVFLGWSLASVLGLPMAAWLSDTFGWRVAFSAVAVLGVLAAAWVFAVMPDGVKPAALTLRAWKQVLTHPVLMPMVGVTALLGAGQFTLFSYLTAFYRLDLGASPNQIAVLLMWFGACGLIGNVVLTRVIDRMGPARAVLLTTGLIAVSLMLWQLGTGLLSMALVLLPWGLGCFASNSAQQARLGVAAPLLAPALMSLNTSAIYFGQAAGAASGGWLIEHGGGFGSLHWIGLAWVVLAMGVSVWVGRQAVVIRQ